ncbi:hypothetical protein EIP86_006893 [Pleurotus ostreatoroseus]|nr:hypothetical protein EIP86_006893 [Pleurotus ostreatoroseus]
MKLELATNLGLDGETLSSSTGVVNTFPIELIERILKAIFDGCDIATLRCCALICSKWNAACRLYLFQRIKIESEERLNEFKALLESKPDVGYHVYELVIRPASGQLPEPVGWFAKFPFALSPHLARLRTIEFANLWEDFVAADFMDELSKLTTVTQLVARDSFLSQSILEAFACAFPNLRDFCIGELYLLPPSSWDPTPSRLYDPCLSSLCVDPGSKWPDIVSQFLSWAISTGSRTTLQSLSLMGANFATWIYN